MRLLTELLAKPANLPASSKYTAMNGIIYLSAGALLIFWPGATQAIFRERAFVGDEAALVRVMGLTLVVIGWLYLFGGRSGALQIVAASVVDRLVFVPAVLLPLAIAGVFPRLLGHDSDSRPSARHRGVGNHEERSRCRKALGPSWVLAEMRWQDRGNE